MSKQIVIWVMVGFFGLFLLPWYLQEEGFWTLAWLSQKNDEQTAAAIRQIIFFKRIWLFPLCLFSALPLLLLVIPRHSVYYARVLLCAGGGGLGYLLLQAFTVGIAGWEFAWLNVLLGELSLGQFGLGYGAILTAVSYIVLLSYGLAAKGSMRGDVFVIASIALVIALVAVFVFLPVGYILISAFIDFDGTWSSSAFGRSFLSSTVWGIDCLTGSGYCGVALNTLGLGLLTATSTTVLGLIFALVVTRTEFRYKKILRMLSVLPIITPPFVIGLALILMFGRSGAVTQFLANIFNIEAGRWIYGLQGIWLAQTLSLTPISFLVMIGVVEGISPSMEEASQTMRADRWQTFKHVSLPLMRPGIAAAFLLGFIESMADFGNPMILGGSFSVLSTEIFFSVVGAQNDPNRVAVLAIILLCFTLSAFALQRFWLGNKSYTTVTGKGDSGAHISLSAGLKRSCYMIAIPWALFTLLLYVLIIYGGFVEHWGRDNSFTLSHYRTAFGLNFAETGTQWIGTAWNSFFTTLNISAVAAPLTAAMGLITAYLLVRQQFVGKSAFEFGTMLSFAIPGTVIGVSYILAFNIPPFELVGTSTILIACFVFRNMSVGVRGGIAAMSQLDRHLDEASLTLGANSFTTFRCVILPLLRPAIVASLVYSFVRSITSLSAVIFLVSAEHNMATSFIIGLVENNRYGVAIAYSSVLIVVMLVAILSIQLLVGKRQLRSEERVA